MQDGFYAANDDSGAKRSPFATMDLARRGAAEWIANGDEVLVHEVEGGRIGRSWECADGEVMGTPDFEGREMDADGLEAVAAN